MQKMMIAVLISAAALAACVSEEGAREHAAKSKSDSSISHVPGMVWVAEAYRVRGESEVIGRYATRAECNEASASYLSKHRDDNEKSKQPMVSSCGIAPE